MQKYIFVIFSIVILSRPFCVFAEEVVVEENEPRSETLLIRDLVYDKQIAKTNYAKIENNLTINASSGDNNATNSAGDTTIQTGNVRITIDIVNDLNKNTLRELHEQLINNTESSIQENNLLSVKSIQTHLQEQKDIFQSNRAEVENNITSRATTGQNTINAMSKSRDIKIVTGNVKKTTSIINAINPKTNQKLLPQKDTRVQAFHSLSKHQTNSREIPNQKSDIKNENIQLTGENDLYSDQWYTNPSRFNFLANDIHNCVCYSIDRTYLRSTFKEPQFEQTVKENYVYEQDYAPEETRDNSIEDDELVYYYYPNDDLQYGDISQLRGLSDTGGVTESYAIYLLTLSSLFLTTAVLISRFFR